MGNQNILSLVLFRAVGQNSGVPAERLGPLSIASYMLGNPIVAMMLARSGQFGSRGAAPPAAPALAALPEPGPDLAQIAKDAAKSAEAALGSSKNAENAAKAAALSETNAKGFAEEAKAAAGKGGKNP